MLNAGSSFSVASGTIFRRKFFLSAVETSDHGNADADHIGKVGLRDGCDGGIAHGNRALRQQDVQQQPLIADACGERDDECRNAHHRHEEAVDRPHEQPRREGRRHDHRCGQPIPRAKHYHHGGTEATYRAERKVNLADDEDE